jgi:uncharacterized tellurite resistance protein B-like protein
MLNELKTTDFKAATIRLFFDMINADGIIEDSEIVLFEKLKKKYNINATDVAYAHHLTTCEAIKILMEWQTLSNLAPQYKDPKQTSTEVFKDLIEISGCDNDRDLNEAKLLACVSLCLNGEAIPIKYKERNLRFSKKEIIYIASNKSNEIEAEINRSKRYIECLLSIYGYDFIYLPDTIAFLKEKAVNGLLTSILMFSKPLSLTEEDTTDEFVSEIQKITTEEFTSAFISSAGLINKLPPSLLVKIKSSTIPELDDTGEWHLNKYSDFIAIPIQNSVEEAVKTLPLNILMHTDGITSLVTRHLEEKLYCRGIHKTLIDYTIGKSLSNSVTSIIMNVWGRTKWISFVGIGAPHVNFKPKELAVYLLIAVLSLNPSHRGLFIGNDMVKIKEMEKLYSKIYTLITGKSDDNLYGTLGVHISKITKKIQMVENLFDRSRYLPIKSKYHYLLHIRPDLIYIRTTNNSGGDVSLLDWIQQQDLQKDIIDNL